MKTRFCYGFEELSDDLPRPPKAALRAMFSAGILVSPRGWKQLTNETRQALSLEGARDKVNIPMVADLLKEAPPGQIRLVSKTADPPHDQVPAPLANALGPMRTIPPAEWASLRALDRYVLASLAANTRLLWKALEEMARMPGSKLSKRVVEPWSGSLARCDLVLLPEAIERLTSSRFLDGRAFVLARAAGVRAARRVADTLDMRADTVTGPAELDWALDKKGGMLLWQAHVSTWDGEFYPAASLLAVSTAAVALYDMAKELDPHGIISNARIAEEPWQVGHTDREEATSVYSAENHPEMFSQRAEHGSEEPPPSTLSTAAMALDTIAVSRPQPGPDDSHGPYSSPEPEAPAPPPNLVIDGDRMSERASLRPQGDQRLNPRTFMLMLMASMIVVALISTVVSVVVVRMLMK
ncbi:MAG: hypothetical protein HY898_25665 [Deltaproteobacteria bacterium]|nr:hypothetical protein [Deltaproteobacteria bacterium]